MHFDLFFLRPNTHFQSVMFCMKEDKSVKCNRHAASRDKKGKRNKTFALDHDHMFMLSYMTLPGSRFSKDTKKVNNLECMLSAWHRK